MNFRLLVIFAACSVAFAETGTELFQKAVVQERAAGNLEEAIKIYQRVAREYPKDRPLAAKALVQAARCYEKLGQDKAIKLYGQVISEFGDQRELAAVSRERLAALTPPKANSSAGMVARQIPTRVSSLQPFESDGRRLFNVDRGDLMVAAMDGSNAKTIFASENSGGRGRIMSLPSISRDGSRAAFKLSRATDAICVVGSDGSGFRQIFDFGRRTPALLGGWSHDGRYLLAFVIEPDAPSGSLVSISVADGSVRKLVNGGLPSPQTRLFEPPLAQFSPDGRYVAYSKGGGRIGKPEAPQPERGVYIVSADGVNQGHFAEQPGAAVLLDWTADGRYILFVGNRTGVPAIYAQAVAGGKPQGDPILIKQDAGEVWKGFMSKDGSLLYSVTGSQGELRVLSLDPRNKGVSGAGERFPLKFKESPMGAAWSADGRMVAYSLTTQRAGEHRLVIRTLDTGQERELTLPGPGGTIEWARDGSTVYESSAPRHTVESITLADGAVRQIATFDKALRSIMATADGKALLIELNSLERTDASIVRHDLETEVDTVMVSKPLAFRLAVSPDGTRVAAIDRDPDGNQSVSVKPATGGEWNRLATLGTSGGQQLWWTADSAGLIISRGRSQARSLWGVSVADGAAVQLTEFPPEGRINVIAIRPDGEQVLLLAQESPAELWALENFGSKLQRTR